MKLRLSNNLILILCIAFISIGMARHGEYDEEAREAERIAKRNEQVMPKRSGNAATNFAGGVKEATYDSTKEFISETADSTKEEAPIIGTLEGARLGSGKVLDKTVRGAYKVATLGMGTLDKYEVVEPESGSGEPTKIKIGF